MASTRLGSSLTNCLRATASGMPCCATMSSMSASTCHTTMRSVIWPMARVTEMAASSVSFPARTRSRMVESAARSRSVNATSWSPKLGKPSARHSLRADKSETPAPAATSRRRSLRSPPRSLVSRALMASRSADMAPVGGDTTGRTPVGAWSTEGSGTASGSWSMYSGSCSSTLISSTFSRLPGHRLRVVNRSSKSSCRFRHRPTEPRHSSEARPWHRG